MNTSSYSSFVSPNDPIVRENNNELGDAKVVGSPVKPKLAEAAKPDHVFIRKMMRSAKYRHLVERLEHELTKFVESSESRIAFPVGVAKEEFLILQFVANYFQLEHVLEKTSSLAEYALYKTCDSEIPSQTLCDLYPESQETNEGNVKINEPTLLQSNPKVPSFNNFNNMSDSNINVQQTLPSYPPAVNLPVLYDYNPSSFSYNNIPCYSPVASASLGSSYMGTGASYSNYHPGYSHQDSYSSYTSSYPNTNTGYSFCVTPRCSTAPGYRAVESIPTYPTPATATAVSNNYLYHSHYPPTHTNTGTTTANPPTTRPTNPYALASHHSYLPPQHEHTASGMNNESSSALFHQYNHPWGQYYQSSDSTANVDLDFNQQHNIGVNQSGESPSNVFIFPYETNNHDKFNNSEYSANESNENKMYEKPGEKSRKKAKKNIRNTSKINDNCNKLKNRKKKNKQDGRNNNTSSNVRLPFQPVWGYNKRKNQARYGWRRWKTDPGRYILEIFDKPSHIERSLEDCKETARHWNQIKHTDDEKDPFFYICWDYNTNGCPREGQCNWLHETVEISKKQDGDITTNVSDTKKNIPKKCSQCKKGEKENQKGKNTTFNCLLRGGATIQWINDDIVLAVFRKANDATKMLKKFKKTPAAFPFKVRRWGTSNSN